MLFQIHPMEYVTISGIKQNTNNYLLIKDQKEKE